MFDSTYISCPAIGFDHLLTIVTKEFNLANGSPQWDVCYPTPEQPDHINEAEYDAWLDEFAEELGLNEPTEEIATVILFGDPDHQIHRPDDDFADIDNQDYEDDDEPACGDCGGCCECLGDPEVEPRFDTLAEQEEFYRETAEDLLS